MTAARVPPSRIRSKMHRAKPQGGRDWGDIGFNPGPNEPFLDPIAAAREVAAKAANPGGNN